MKKNLFNLFGLLGKKSALLDKKEVSEFETTKMFAERGHVNEQYILGEMYFYGLGVTPDYSEAKRWFGKACDNGLEYGCE